MRNSIAHILRECRCWTVFHLPDSKQFLAAEWGRLDIRLNATAMGMTKTPMLRDAAAYMQGSIVYVDGGADAQLRPDAF